jgi:hypothetical protein
MSIAWYWPEGIGGRPEMSTTEKPELPGWDDLSDLDKGAALLHIHKREWEGAEYAESDYPARYFDHPALTALPALEASRHAASLADDAEALLALDQAEYLRLYNAALDAEEAPRGQQGERQ